MLLLLEDGVLLLDKLLALLVVLGVHVVPGHLQLPIGLCYQFYHHRFCQLGPDDSFYRTYQFPLIVLISAPGCAWPARCPSALAAAFRV